MQLWRFHEGRGWWLLAGWFTVSAASAAYPPQADLAAVQRSVAAADKDHPRLMADRQQLRALRELHSRGGVPAGVADEVIAQARQCLEEPPVTRTMQGRRLLGVSRQCLERVLALATAHHLTGEKRYAQRAEREMLAAAAFTDWNPRHFLDVGEMALALGIGYDWLYDQLTAESRQQIRTALVEKALRLPFETRHRGWVKARNNWGQVCHGGLTAAALAIMEDEPDLAARTVHNALRHVPRSMEAYAPKGGYPEGPGYWAYGTTYNVILLAAMRSVLGTDFGLSDAPGFDQTGQYLPLMTGPSGQMFNYADGSAARRPQPALFWLARQYDRPDWLRDEAALLAGDPSRAGRLLPLTLLWWEKVPDTLPVRMPLHWQSGGQVPVSVHRSSWQDDHAVFVGVKGGSPSANHGQMDIGSFVLDADGIRWALDLGAEGYHGIESRGMNLWDMSQDSDRWTIFRQMNHGHNTLVIDGHHQRVDGFGRFEHFSDRPAFPHSLLDLSSVYEEGARTVRRGVALLPSRCVLIRDELTGLRTGASVQWNLLTQANASGQGGAELTLRQGQARLILRLLKPQGTAWDVTDVSEPRREWDSPNPGVRKVGFRVAAPREGALTLLVLVRPGEAREPPLETLASRTLAEWKSAWQTSGD